ncbi:putative membrane protein [Peribacillus huizhouensis]|uniref:Membrane protein n=1 Tax=Peribacillus huizhouensis TaxID=1501239 RepID=A0ABR6CU90_9BACI|nr:putative membrane protein [Peribacillus huizhouensis]
MEKSFTKYLLLFFQYIFFTINIYILLGSLASLFPFVIYNIDQGYILANIVRICIVISILCGLILTFIFYKKQINMKKTLIINVVILVLLMSVLYFSIDYLNDKISEPFYE